MSIIDDHQNRSGEMRDDVVARAVVVVPFVVVLVFVIEFICRHQGWYFRQFM